jgi:uncharacterized protein
MNKLFDPHIHMTSRTTDDYQAMAKAGIAAIIEPAFWLGQPRTHVGSFEDYFLSLLGWERFRASQYGIKHYCTIGLNPKEANTQALAEGVMELLPLYLEKEGVVAVGEIGYDDITPHEEQIFARQIQLAKDMNLPVLIHTPHRDKKRGTERTIALLRDIGFPEGMALIDHNNEITLPMVLDTGCWAGHSIYPSSKMDEARMVELVREYGAERMLVNSAADWGQSDALKVPKTAQAFLNAGFGQDVVDRICWENPVRFFSQSGRMAEAISDSVAVDQTQLFEGNSVLRGQAPRVDAK